MRAARHRGRGHPGRRRLTNTSGILRSCRTSGAGSCRSVAQRVADALPLEVAEEVVLTGSVSRGVADEVSDIEMLIVTPEPMELAACFEHARAAGLEELDTWGDQSTPTRRVSGYLEGVPLELIWWSREHAESSIESFFSGGCLIGRRRDRSRRLAADVGIAVPVASPPQRLSGGAREGADRGRRPDVGRVHARGAADARPPR